MRSYVIKMIMISLLLIVANDHILSINEKTKNYDRSFTLERVNEKDPDSNTSERVNEKDPDSLTSERVNEKDPDSNTFIKKDENKCQSPQEGSLMKEEFIFIKEDADKLYAYKEYNDEVIALIKIEGTKLDHPVMKCEENEGFYLWHDLDKKRNSHGVPFATLLSDLSADQNNSLIYGHRSADGDVFGELIYYEDEDFYKEHPLIETITEKGNSRWLIIAFCKLRNDEEDAFEYYEKYRFDSQKDYEYFFKEIGKRNIISSTMEHDIEDTYLTLSSCSKEGNSEGTNRILLVAKRIPYYFSYSDIVEKTEYKYINTSKYRCKKAQNLIK